MIQRPVLLAALAVVACAGGGVGFVLWRQAAARAELRRQIEASVQVELSREPRDQGALLLELKRIDVALRDAKDPELRLLMARVQYELGRLQDAWDTVADLALAPGGPVAALELGALVLAAWHAQSGEIRHAEQAYDLAERHALATGSVESAFLAWQCAVRAQRPDAADRLADRLQVEYPNAPLSRLVALLRAFDPVSSAADAPALAQLDRELEQTPPELTVAQALLVLAGSDQSAVPAATAGLEAALQRYPALVELRNALVVAYHQLGDAERRDPHLRWLLQNAPPQDARRANWELLLKGG